MEAAKELEIPDATVARYDGSFFQLRHDIDSLLRDEHPPRLVVYVPADRHNTHHALVELEATGVVLQPGQQSPNRNTRLAVMARNALKPILGEQTASEIEKQVESGKLSLADLNALADKGKDMSTGVLSLIFGTATPQDVALAFLNSEVYDREVDKKSARKDLLRRLICARHWPRLALIASLIAQRHGTLPASRQRVGRERIFTAVCPRRN